MHVQERNGTSARTSTNTRQRRPRPRAVRLHPPCRSLVTHAETSDPLLGCQFRPCAFHFMSFHLASCLGRASCLFPFCLKVFCLLVPTLACYHCMYISFNPCCNIMFPVCLHYRTNCFVPLNLIAFNSQSLALYFD